MGPTHDIEASPPHPGPVEAAATPREHPGIIEFDVWHRRCSTRGAPRRQTASGLDRVVVMTKRFLMPVVRSPARRPGWRDSAVASRGPRAVQDAKGRVVAYADQEMDYLRILEGCAILSERSGDFTIEGFPSLGDRSKPCDRPDWCR